MPVYLPAPEPDHRGPDGKGRNRLRIESIWLDECALRPTSWQTLWIAQTDTRRAWYGNFGPCGRTGRCDGCAVWEAPPLACRDHGDGSGRMLARLDPRRRDLVWLMVNPDLGWDSDGYRWTWAQLARLRGWQADRGHVDEHGEGFWLRRVPVTGTVRRRLPLTWLVAARDAVTAALTSAHPSPRRISRSWLAAGGGPTACMRSGTGYTGSPRRSAAASGRSTPTSTRCLPPSRCGRPSGTSPR